MDFPGCPVVKYPPCNAGNMDLVPGRGTRITHTMEQLSPRAATRDSASQWKILHDPMQLRPNPEE